MTKVGVRLPHVLGTAHLIQRSATFPAPYKSGSIPDRNSTFYEDADAKMNKITPSKLRSQSIAEGIGEGFGGRPYPRSLTLMTGNFSEVTPGFHLEPKGTLKPLTRTYPKERSWASAQVWFKPIATNYLRHASVYWKQDFWNALCIAITAGVDPI